MKAKDFFELVKKMMTKQADYRAAKRNGTRNDWEPLLWAASDLERQVWMVLKDGALEPDEPTATIHVYTTEEYQRQKDLMENRSDEPTLAEYLKPEIDDQT
ncbi:MAG: hypothetical protein HY865_09485 [Chloroflexi bacterium]|nr:hypothetical protein [Chloroflexota bacterium]